MKSWILIAALAWAGTARADQCAVVDGDVGAKAEALLAKQPMVIEYCEPCGDKAPGVPEPATRVTVGTEIAINGKPVDLAYTYVQTAPKQYRNMAMLAGCPVEGVSPSLEVSAETAHGVMISASDRASDATPVAPAVAPLPAPPVHTVYVYATTQEVPWLALAFAFAGGLVSGGASVLLARALYRRRPLRPRATDL